MKKTTKKKQKLRIFFLGGLGEVGRNMMVLEWEKKYLIVDMGLRLPEETMPGIDYLIPNVSFLKRKGKKIVGAVFTHGHYDHIGAIPYLMPRLNHNFPLYAGALTRGIILKRQEDFPHQKKLKVIQIKDKDKITIDKFKIEFVRLNHNIPDNFGLLITTPLGKIFHTSDFKFDPHPVYDKPTNFRRLRKIGKEGVLLMLSDSTGAEEEGHSHSEKTIMENLEKIFKEVKGRIIATTFASLINRIQQIIFLSEKYDRKVAIDGYSMRTNVEICKKLRYLSFKRETIISLKHIDRYPDKKITILCTGAQGEEGAVLMKIANRQHPIVKIRKGDSVIFSSSVIPGNERSIQILKDNLLRQGAKVYHYKMMDIHASGHAKQEELKKMIAMIKPKFFIPIHGQYSMLLAHAELAKEVGIKEKNIVVAENGNIVRLDEEKISLEKRTVPAGYVMVDGLGVKDLEEVVLRDRKVLAEDGIFVIIVLVDRQTGRVKGSPDIISRGFIYLRESKALLAETRRRTINIINKASRTRIVNWTYLKNELRNKLGEFLYRKTQKRPMVLPVIIEI